jgi:hypothetical protein
VAIDVGSNSERWGDMSTSSGREWIAFAVFDLQGQIGAIVSYPFSCGNGLDTQAHQQRRGEILHDAREVFQATQIVG